MDGYGRRGERGACGGCGGRRRWTWGGGGVPGGVRGSGSGGGRARGGHLVWPEGGGGGGHGADVRSWWRPGERELRERGLGGSWWHPGERERREWVIEARWRCGECGPRERVCRAGLERERRRLRDRASSLESGKSGGVCGSWGASRGAAWYWGGGLVPRRPSIRHVGVWWRQRLVVWVE